MKKLIEKLYINNNLEYDELLYLVRNISSEDRKLLFKNSSDLRERSYGRDVYLRGLLEISNICSRSCSYCGINGSNKKARRYRLSKEDIIYSCQEGYELGYRTFVLQGGEDPYFTDELIEAILLSLKSTYDDIRLTLSLGEKDYSSYKRFFKAGADRYLLRHETADSQLFKEIHPEGSFEERRECLYMLKDIGYQVGAGFMVGIPGQTEEVLVKDLTFLKELQPEMVGLGPFIPHKDTIYKDCPAGDLDLTLLMLALVRNLLPEVLLPATTALSSLSKNGRNSGLKLGANVIMPNISPVSAREKYSLYNNKAYGGSEAGEELEKIKKEIEEIGFNLSMLKGDHVKWK